jgi:hypothetical protein
MPLMMGYPNPKFQLQIPTTPKRQIPNQLLTPNANAEFRLIESWLWELGVGWDLEVGSGWDLELGTWDLIDS